MFIAKCNEIISCVGQTEQEVKNILISACVNLDNYTIEETDVEYILYNGRYKPEIEVLALIKQAKLKEASDKAKEAIENGYVIYKEAQFETNTQTLSDLGDERSICLALGQTSTMWLSKDDKAVELILDDVDPVNNDDIFKIGLLAKQFKNQIWNERYVAYLEQIETAQTVEEVEAIVIDYTTNEEVVIEEPVVEEVENLDDIDILR